MTEGGGSAPRAPSAPPGRSSAVAASNEEDPPPGALSRSLVVQPEELAISELRPDQVLGVPIALEAQRKKRPRSGLVGCRDDLGDLLRRHLESGFPHAACLGG